MKSQPPHFGGSLILSAKTFGYALGSGFGGIVLQPKRGEFLINRHRDGLNRGVPMERSIQIIGDKFTQKLNTEMIPFSTKLVVLPSLVYKGSGERRKMAASMTL